MEWRNVYTMSSLEREMEYYSTYNEFIILTVLIIRSK